MSTTVEQKFAQFQVLLADAKRRYPASELARLEEGFRVIAGEIPAPAKHPLQYDAFVFSGLEARAWHDAAQFEQVRVLEAAWEVIRDEALAVRERRLGFQPMNADKDAPHVGEWNAFHIKIKSGIVEEDRHLWPQTARIIETLPNMGETALVSSLNPGCHIQPHCGPWNAGLTIHLPLVVPDGDCAFRVGTETRKWEEGRCLVFEDSFEHEAWNRGDRTRMVLLVDIWHPALSPIETELLQSISDLVVLQGGFEEARRERKHVLDGKRWWVDRPAAGGAA